MRVDTLANMAVGFAPWGPFAAATHPALRLGERADSFSERFPIAIDERSHIEWPLDLLTEKGVIVIGREMHRSTFARDAIDALRDAGVPALAVEMGWPGAEDGYADLATFGSSALVGSALLTLIEDV